MRGAFNSDSSGIFVGMIRWRKWILLGMLGGIGGVIADLVLLYQSGGDPQIYERNIWGDIWAFSESRLAAGHFMGIFMMPLQWFGLRAVLSRAGVDGTTRALAEIAAMLMVAVGLAYHGSLAFSARAFSRFAQMEFGSPALDLVEYHQAFFGPLEVALLSLFVGLSFWLGVRLWSVPSLPKRLAWANPILPFGLCALLYISAPDIGNFLFPPAFNLSILIFLSAVFFTGDAPLPKRPRWPEKH